MFDCVIIGGGPGGYRTAELLAERKQKVALVEENKVGGVCLNEGCIPFKYYLHLTRLKSEINGLTKDCFRGEEIRLDQERIHQAKRDLVKRLSVSLERQLESKGVKIIHSRAEIVDCTEEKISVRAGGEILVCKSLVLALGSTEKELKKDEVLNYQLIGSREMLDLKKIPVSVEIIGSGAIGLEAASYFVDAGSGVTLIEMEDTIGGHMDADIAKYLARILERKGVEIITGMRLLRFEREEVIFQKGKDTIRRRPGFVLYAGGRKPRLDESLLQALNVEYHDGGVLIDKECRTSNPNVYACGDVTGKWMLAHGAYDQARVVADSILGKKKNTGNCIMPRIIYSNPEVLSVGVTELDCQKEGKSYRTETLPMTYSGRYYAEHGKDGAYAKMIIDQDECVMGFHMIGNGASEIGIAVEMIIANHMTVSDVKRLVFPHPTNSEILYELAGMF